MERCTLDRARQIAEKLIDSIREYSFYWQDGVFNIGASLGIKRRKKAD